MKDIVSRVTRIPLRHKLSGGSYGSSRGVVDVRQSTLVRLETGGGVIGWGECWGPSGPVLAILAELSAAIEGMPISSARRIVSNAADQNYHRAGSAFSSAISGVDIALWDATGRILDTDIASLLGGRYRDHVTAYASAGYVTPDRSIDVFRHALETASAGFLGAKIKCGLGIAKDLERIRAAREILGPDRGLMVDINGNYTADVALGLVSKLAEFSIDWLEEPLPPTDTSGFGLLAGRGVPIATGEAYSSRFGFHALLRQRAVDVVQPDITKVGGISEARIICDLAATWNVRVSPHVWGGAIGLAAALQLLAALPCSPHTENVPTPLWLEFDRGENALRDAILTTPIECRDGLVAVPDGPGLGIDVNEDAVRSLRVDL